MLALEEEVARTAQMTIAPALVGRLVMAREVSSTAASDDETASHAHLHTSYVL